MKMSEMDRRKLHSELAEATYRSWVDLVYDGIQRVGRDPFDVWQPLRIECKIHRMVITGWYRYKQMQEALGDLWIDATYDPVRRRSPYRTKAGRKVPNFDVTIFFDPIADTPKPTCYMEVVPRGDVPVKRYKEFLQEQASKLPNLMPSQVEYTNDLFCISPKAVENLFELMRRHVYVPYQRKAKTSYGQIIIVDGKETRMSRSYRTGRYKIYERGPDKKRAGPENLDSRLSGDAALQ